MMTLIAKLCSLCAVCTLMQMILEEKRRESVGMIGGLLMLHLVISGAQQIVASLMNSGDLMHLFETLMQ